MIVKMSRYDFVLLATQSDDFIARLRELGLVDITTTGWEPQEKDRLLVTDIDHYRKAIESLGAFADSEEYAESTVKYSSGREAYEAYCDLRQQKTSLQGEIARLEKLAEELKPWGDFEGDARERLAQQGVVLRYFVAQSSTYDALAEQWANDYTVVEIGRDSSSVYFVVVTTPAAEIVIDAQEVKAPQMDSRAAMAEAEKCREQISRINLEISGCAANVGVIED
ncbi:MAG: V-type ATP synthase subunit I, partial [Alistipes sp.]|nr:V-type ATP synthase subunit I [Alistipes sp.]